MANGWAKIQDINDGNIAGCAVHKVKIEKNEKDINSLADKIEKKIILIIRILIGAGLLLLIDLGTKAVPFLKHIIIGG